MGRITIFEYDILGRKIKEINPDGGVTRFSYNQRSDLISVTDAGGNVTSYLYDGNGRKIAEDRPSVSGQRAARHLINFAYDDADRLLSKKFFSSVGSIFNEIEFQYDAFDRMVRKILKNGNMVEDDAVYSYENQLDAELMNSAVNTIYLCRTHKKLKHMGRALILRGSQSTRRIYFHAGFLGAFSSHSLWRSARVFWYSFL